MLIQVAYGHHDIAANTDRDGTWKGLRLYTYFTNWDIGVGDIVRVPGNAFNPQAQDATVVRLGSSYDGDVTSVLSVVARAGGRRGS
jgi:hypothetical protein